MCMCVLGNIISNRKSFTRASISLLFPFESHSVFKITHTSKHTDESFIVVLWCHITCIRKQIDNSPKFRLCNLSISARSQCAFNFSEMNKKMLVYAMILTHATIHPGRLKLETDFQLSKWKKKCIGWAYQDSVCIKITVSHWLRRW